MSKIKLAINSYGATIDLTDIEHNVLLVALDTLEEQLNDIRSDLDTYEDEATNLNRLVAIKNLKQILKDYE
jgi:t-SNARE complex subunit (syntaxin)